MYIEVSYSIAREICSQRFPHRLAASSSEAVDAWCKEMDAKHGEMGWTIGDENVHASAPMPRWPLWTPTSWAWFQRYEGGGA